MRESAEQDESESRKPRRCLPLGPGLAWWRDELLMLLFERGIDEALRQRQGLLAEGRLLLARVKSRRG